MALKGNTVPTGIPGFDELLGGGFPKGSVITVSGDTGAGKSIFASQFLYSGLTKFSEPGFYISFDERKRLMYRNLAKFGWNFSAYEAQKKFIFIEFPIHEASQFIAQENTMFNFIVEMGIERVVIDPITPLAMLHSDEQKRRQELMKLVNTLRSWGTTTLLVAESEDEKDIAGIGQLSDGIIKLRNIEKDSYKIRAVDVVKMRGVEHAQRICPFKITNSGIEVYPHQYVYDD
jgi:KaiC/GvpD/RAD55 family RecA-like ATPase